MTESVPVRGFPAFPARKGRTVRGVTWWGRAWTDAMEDTALDSGPLRKGRAYAGSGRVGPITVSPGRITATVDGADGIHHTTVFLEQLTPAQRARFLDQVIAQAGHIAALLDRDMPQDLVTAADDAGVPLLPGIGDLEPECDCPDWELPCTHAAALCYQASWLLDEDPFVLLLMRGLDERSFLDALTRPPTTPGPTTPGPAASRPAAAPAGTPGAEAWAAPVAPLPDDPPVPCEPAPLLDIAAPPELVPGALELLAADAALRALELLTGNPRPLDLWQDTVRWAACHPEPAVMERLHTAALPRAVRAWRLGGPAGLDALESAWTPPPAAMARARAAFAGGADTESTEDGAPTSAQPWRNRLTFAAHGIQLRYGRDGLWYPFRQEDEGRWWPAATPDRDPVEAYAAVTR